MRKSIPVTALLGVILLTGLAGCARTPAKIIPHTGPTPAISSIAPSAAATPTPTITVPAAQASQYAADNNRAQAIAALQNAGNDWYDSLGPALKDKVYTRATAAKLVPKGTVIIADPKTWQPNKAGTQGDITATVTYPGGHSAADDFTLIKLNGRWFINFTSMHM